MATMDHKISERTRRQLEKLPPDKRARAEAIVARTQTPEYRAREREQVAALDREFREAGRIATASPPVLHLVGELRRAREALGLSLADVAGRSGIDKSSLSRLENGLQHTPTIATLQRYAAAVGKRVALGIEDAE